MTEAALLIAIGLGRTVSFPRWVWIAIVFDIIVVIPSLISDVLQLVVWTMEKMS